MQPSALELHSAITHVRNAAPLILVSTVKIVPSLGSYGHSVGEADQSLILDLSSHNHFFLSNTSYDYPFLSGKGFKCPSSRPLLTRGPFFSSPVKTAPFRTAVRFNGQILAEAKPGLIWTD